MANRGEDEEAGWLDEIRMTAKARGVQLLLVTRPQKQLRTMARESGENGRQGGGKQLGGEQLRREL
jgi:hypothetical protein